MGRKKHDREPETCPVGRFFHELEKTFGTQSEMIQHFNRSQLELLKALRAFVDGRIERLEKEQAAKQKKKATKIEVE